MESLTYQFDQNTRQLFKGLGRAFGVHNSQNDHTANGMVSSMFKAGITFWTSISMLA
jgi:hypothetical protein